MAGGVGSFVVLHRSLVNMLDRETAAQRLEEGCAKLA